MVISATRLVSIIAQRLDPVAPRPFRVRPYARDLAFDHPEWGFIMGAEFIEDETETRTAEELAQLIIGNALEALQDVVSESSKEPWPPLTPTAMAPVHVRSDGQRVYFWYGISETAPVIGFEPIALNDVTRS